MKGERKATHHFVDAVSSCLVLTPYLEELPWLFLSFPLMVVVIAALPVEHSFLPRQHFSPSAVPPHPGCFIHKTPPPSHQAPVYFHSEDSYLLFMSVAAKIQANAPREVIFILSIGRLK